MSVWRNPPREDHLTRGPPGNSHLTASKMNTISSTTLRTALVLGLAATSAAAQNLMSQHGEVVLAAGQNAPGIPGFTTYNTNAFAFGSPVVDQNGTILVQSRLLPSGIDDRAIFIGRNGSDMQLVVQSNTQAPGLPAGTMLKSNSLTSGSGLENDPAISPFNEILFFGSRIFDTAMPTNTPSTSDHAIFWGPVGGIQVIAREGTQVPGMPAGVNYGSTSFSRQYNKVNSSGTVVFKNDMGGATTSADDAVMLTGVPGALTIVAREGDQAPGMAAGILWNAASGGTMSFLVGMNDAAEIVFSPKLIGPGITTANDSVMATYQPGAGATIWAQEGDQAPGMPAGTVLSGTPAGNSANWNNSGQMLLGWNMADGGVSITTANDQTLWLGGLAGMSMVVREGDATGFAGSETFGVFNNTSQKRNESGTIVFNNTLRDATGASLPTTDDSAMVIGTPGNWSQIVREGQIIPEIPASVNGPWTCRSVTGSTNLNSRGQVLFNQSCTDGVDIVTHYLCYTPGLGIQVVANATTSYTTGLGTGTATTSISNAGTQGNSDGGSLWFNNAGDFAFRQSVDSGVQSVLARGHCGNLYGTPASIDGAAGGTHTFTVDAGVANANNIYAIIGTQSGTRPGTLLPAFGTMNIPVNFDAWTSLSIDLFNTAIYTNTLWFTDAAGKGTASFNLPAGLVSSTLLHHTCIGLDLNLMETFVSEPVSLKIN